jgi:hypothetical protein
MNKKEENKKHKLFPEDPNRDGLTLHKNLAMGKFDKEKSKKKKDKF